MVCWISGAQSAREIARPSVPSLSFSAIDPCTLGACSFPKLLLFATDVLVDHLCHARLALYRRTRLLHDRRAREECHRSKSRICPLPIHISLPSLNQAPPTSLRNCR